MLVSLTTTPTMCARLLADKKKHGKLYLASEKFFDFILKTYERSLGWVMGHSAIVLVIAIATLCLNIYLFVIVPKGFFPQQDAGRLNGNFMGDQSTSFQAMQQKIQRLAKVVEADPAVEAVQAFSGGGGGTNTTTGRCFITLKPLGQRRCQPTRLSLACVRSLIPFQA